MTLEQLDSTLPNGLHDAQIRKLVRNFEDATLALSVKILVGLPSEAPEERSRYRNAEIVFHGVQFFAVEYPDGESPFRTPGSLWFSFGRSDSSAIPDEVSRKLSPDIQRYSLFIQKWYSSIHIAADEISFTWS